MNRIALTVVTAFVACVIGCSKSSELLTVISSSTVRVPPSAAAALQNADKFELLSLDPERLKPDADEANLYGWKILGTAEITDSMTKEKLVRDFSDGVTGYDGPGKQCFDPRHAIRVTRDGKMYELLICFECSQVMWYVDGQMSKGTFTIGNSPEPTFDAVLSKADVPLAPKRK